MWAYLADHPWWGLTYLVILCLTSTFWAMGIGAALGARRKAYLEEYTGRRAKSEKDMVH